LNKATGAVVAVAVKGPAVKARRRPVKAETVPQATAVTASAVMASAVMAVAIMPRVSQAAAKSVVAVGGAHADRNRRSNRPDVRDRLANASAASLTTLAILN